MGIFQKKREEKARKGAKQEAFTKLVEQAESGNAAAQYELYCIAFNIHNKYDVQLGPDAGKKWLKIAADNQHPEALLTYARRYCEKDDAAYMHYIELCRKVAPDLADLELGQTYCGLNIWHYFQKLDFEKGLSLLAPLENTAAAEQNADIIYTLAKAYHASGNYEKALKLYPIALDRLSTDDDRYASTALDYGVCILEHTEDKTRAEKYFNIASKYGRNRMITLVQNFTSHADTIAYFTAGEELFYNLFNDFGVSYFGGADSYSSDYTYEDIQITDYRKSKYAYYTNRGFFFSDI